MKKYVLLFVFLAACQSTNTIDVSSYAPVIDVKGDGHDQGTYFVDLSECRVLGARVQSVYQAQRKKEQEAAIQSAFIGALAGAVIGDTIGRNNSNVSLGNATTGGALYGAALGGAIGADQIDYGRVFTKFGPTGIIDQCMANRGYRILSVHGFGGG